MSKLQKKPSALRREHTALQTGNFVIFSTFVGHICPPGSGSGFQIRKHWLTQPHLASEFGRHPDADPSFEIELGSDPETVKILFFTEVGKLESHLSKSSYWPQEQTLFFCSTFMFQYVDLKIQKFDQS